MNTEGIGGGAHFLLTLFQTGGQIMPTTLLIASPRIFQTLLRPTLFGTLPPSKTMTTKMSRLVSLLVIRVGFILLCYCYFVGSEKLQEAS